MATSTASTALAVPPLAPCPVPAPSLLRCPVRDFIHKNRSRCVFLFLFRIQIQIRIRLNNNTSCHFIFDQGLRLPPPLTSACLLPPPLALLATLRQLIPIAIEKCSSRNVASASSSSSRGSFHQQFRLLLLLLLLFVLLLLLCFLLCLNSTLDILNNIDVWPLLTLVRSRQLKPNSPRTEKYL